MHIALENLNMMHNICNSLWNFAVYMKDWIQNTLYVHYGKVVVT